MNLQVFAVWDAAAEAFMNPFFLQTKGQAVRGFSDAVNEPDHQMNRHPEDYTLFHLGSFDPSTGAMELFVAADKVGMAIEFLRSEERHPELVQ